VTNARSDFSHEPFTWDDMNRLIMDVKAGDLAALALIKKTYVKIIQSSNVRSFSGHKLRLMVVSGNVLRAAYYAGANPDTLYTYYINFVQAMTIIRTSEQMLRSILNFSEQCIKAVPPPEKKDESAAAAVKRYIHNNCSRTLSRNSIAAAFFMAPETLSRMFSRHMGITLKDYIIQCRIENAKKLFTHPEKKIREIASLCGFTDANYFSACFAKSTGMPPGKYRKKVAAGPNKDKKLLDISN